MAVCVFRRGDEILVGSHYDREKDETFHGPPGGDEIMGDEGGEPYPVRWMPLARFAPGGPPLYPTGLYDLLRRGDGPPADA
jgi:hypothetical protein